MPFLSSAMLALTVPFYFSFPEEILDVASLLTHVKSQTMVLPRCQGVNVMLSGQRPSSPKRPVGLSVTEI